jgi:hypothetical protein
LIYGELELLDPAFETLRQDDRFKRMASQVKAKLDEQRRRVLALENKER